MPFSNLMKNKIQVLKSDGTKSSEMNASVQSQYVYLIKSDVLIESNDFILHIKSNDDIEIFQVVNPNFNEGLGKTIPAHYQIKIKKCGLLETEKIIQSITYSISNPNAKTNNNSTNNSSHIINKLSKSIDDLKVEINRIALSVQEKEKTMKAIGTITSNIQAMHSDLR